MAKRGGRRCIAAGCSNTNEDGVSLFGFPKDETLKCQWTRQVKRTRAEWPGPTQYSVVCSAHFEEEFFEPGPLLRVQMGIDTRCKLVLKKDAVATKFPRVSVTPSPTALSRTLCCATPTTKGAPVEDTAHTPVSTRPRGAFVKRERRRVSTPWFLTFSLQVWC